VYDRARYSRLSALNVAIGIAISLMLHGLLALWAWNMKLRDAGQTGNASNIALEVRLLRESPPPPPPMIRRQEIVESKSPQQTVSRRAQRPPPSLGTTQAIVGNSPPNAPAGALPDNPTSMEKHIDLAAVHANLGAIVAEVDREKGETPVGQLQAKPLYPWKADTQMGKTIRNTTRPDCRDSIANTGLLAPLFLLAMAADKKDSGCKW